IDPHGDLLVGIPLVSPLAWPLAYRYPVHRIARDAQPHAVPATPTFLLVVRDGGDHVRFKEINAGVFQLLQALQGNESLSGRELLQSMAPAPADAGEFIRSGGAMLEQLRERDVILGTRRSRP